MRGLLILLPVLLVVLITGYSQAEVISEVEADLQLPSLHEKAEVSIDRDTREAAQKDKQNNAVNKKKKRQKQKKNKTGRKKNKAKKNKTKNKKQKKVKNAKNKAKRKNKVKNGKKKNKAKRKNKVRNGKNAKNKAKKKNKVKNGKNKNKVKNGKNKNKAKGKNKVKNGKKKNKGKRKNKVRNGKKKTKAKKKNTVRNGKKKGNKAKNKKIKNKAKRRKKNKTKNNKKAKDRKNKKQKKIRRKTKLKRKQKKQKKGGRQASGGDWSSCGTTGVNDTCLQNAVDSLNFEKNQIQNFLKQKARMTNHNKTTGKKLGKKGEFNESAQHMLTALGGSVKNASCGSNGTKATATAKAAAMKVYTDLTNCSVSIKAACTMKPTMINKTLMSTCAKVYNLSKIAMDDCRSNSNYTSNGPAACNCWEKASIGITEAKKYGCTAAGSSTAKAVKKQKLKCIAAFTACKKQQDSAIKMIHTCMEGKVDGTTSNGTTGRYLLN